MLISQFVSPKFIAPYPTPLPLPALALEQVMAQSLTLFEAPPGYVLTEHLAALLEQPGRGRRLVWLRFDPADADPGSCLVSLVEAARRVQPEIGTQTLEALRHRPGPLYGWPPLFSQLAAELVEGLPADSAIVLENVHHLGHTSPALNLLGSYLLPTLGSRVTCLLLAQASLPRTELPSNVIQRGPADLCLEPEPTARWLRQMGAEFAPDCLARLLRLSEGRAVIVAGLLAAGALLGADLIYELTERAGTASELMVSVAQAWLTTAPPVALSALALDLQMEYSLPGLRAPYGPTPDGPWLQHLQEGWARLHTVWREPLSTVLEASQRRVSVPALQAAARHWFDLGAPEPAVRLHLALGDYAAAASLMDQVADEFLETGQWRILTQWLDQLPPATLRDWPRLMAVAGELAAAQGQYSLAQTYFANAVPLFEARGDTERAARSLLAESALAARQGDLASAHSRAVAAQSLMTGQPASPQFGWSAWQLGRLAAFSGNLDEAARQLALAEQWAAAAGDLTLQNHTRELEKLIQQQRDLAQQRDYHRRAYLDTERAEHEAEARLRERLSAPVDDWMLAGGSAAPRVLGLPVAMTVAAAPPQPPNVISVIRGMLQRLLPATEPAVTHRLTHTNEPAPTELPLDVVNTIPRLVEALPEPEMAQPAEALPELGSKAIVDEVVAPALPATLAAEPASPTLHVYLLGKFRVVINDQAVGRWPASRGLAVFKYLLANHEWPTPREVLMDKFWPDAYEPELARNSLNVAISGLRRALRTLTDRPVIMFEGGAYQLNPDFRVWVDVEEFDRHLHRAQQLASYHQATAALGEYEAALNLYSDDFLADDPYEEWPVVQRERLRVAYLNALDRVSELHLERADYAACVSTCQTLLARDACREDIHCRLMVCFARQDQQPLALRQYQACVEALKTELQVAPAPATTQLYQRLRRREHV